MSAPAVSSPQLNVEGFTTPTTAFCPMLTFRLCKCWYIHMDTWSLCNKTFCEWFCNIHLKITRARPQTSASVLDIIQSGLWSHLMSSWTAHGLTCFLWHEGSPVWRKTPICTMSENRCWGLPVLPKEKKKRNIFTSSSYRQPLNADKSSSKFTCCSTNSRLRLASSK